MIFTAVSDGTYISGKYRLVLENIGFGIPTCTVLSNGGYQVRFVGRSALDMAQAWCKDDAERVPELDLRKGISDGR